MCAVYSLSAERYLNKLMGVSWYKTSLLCSKENVFSLRWIWLSQWILYMFCREKYWSVIQSESCTPQLTEIYFWQPSYNLRLLLNDCPRLFTSWLLALARDGRHLTLANECRGGTSVLRIAAFTHIWLTFTWATALTRCHTPSKSCGQWQCVTGIRANRETANWSVSHTVKLCVHRMAVESRASKYPSTLRSTVLFEEYNKVLLLPIELESSLFCL